MSPKNLNLRDKLEDETLDLSLMQLSDVPVNDIAKITKGTNLDLSNNMLIFLPENFPTLTHLTKLDLSKNQLCELPEYFGQLKNLRHLDLYSNQLERLPVSFAQLGSLKWLDLKNNPLVPALQQAAGNCITASECQMCAKKVVALLQSMQSQLERERQKRFVEEQRLLAEKRKEEEMEREKIRAEKRAAKERRREEAKIRDGDKNKDNYSNRSYTGRGGDVKHEMEKPRNGSHTNGSARRDNYKSGNSCLWMLMKFLMGLMFVCLATGISLLWIYTNGHLDKKSIGEAMPVIRKDIDLTIVTLGKKAGAFQESLGPTMNTIGERTKELYNEAVLKQQMATKWMGENMGPFLSDVVTQIKGGWFWLQDQISELWKWMKPKFRDAWTQARPYFQKLGEIIIEQSNMAYSWAQKNLPIYYDWIVAKMTECYAYVSETLSQSVRG